MGVASGCGEQETCVASGSGWNLWVWLLGVVVRRYIDFLILLIPTPLVSVLFAAASLLFVNFVKCFSFFITIFGQVELPRQDPLQRIDVSISNNYIIKYAALLTGAFI